MPHIVCSMSNETQKAYETNSNLLDSCLILCSFNLKKGCPMHYAESGEGPDHKGLLYLVLPHIFQEAVSTALCSFFSSKILT